LQSASLEHAVLQAVAPQTYGAQAVVAGAGQDPVPAQLAAAVSVPPLHDAERHWVDAPG
jgi:hypothetical protein